MNSITEETASETHSRFSPYYAAAAAIYTLRRARYTRATPLDTADYAVTMMMFDVMPSPPPFRCRYAFSYI